MLICPQCQAENPETHRFCKSCGASFSHVACPSCGTPVERSLLACPQCGTVTGQAWRVIVQPESASTDPAALTQTLEPDTWLDAQERYWITAKATTAATLVETSVLDQQPLQQSPLDSLRDMAQTLESPAAVAASDLAAMVPPLAQPYLALMEMLDPAVPHLHDAWQADGATILVIEDRQDWPAIADSWDTDDIDPLQLVWWLHELSRLWGILTDWQCCRSLTNLDNLCVDEDQILCLRQLYYDSPTAPPQLQELGEIWQQLFQRSQRTLPSDLALVCRDLEAGEIADLETVQARLATIAEGLQPSMDSAEPDWVQPVDAQDNWHSNSVNNNEDVTMPLSLSTAPMVTSTLPDAVEPGLDVAIAQESAAEASAEASDRPAESVPAVQPDAPTEAPAPAMPPDGGDGLTLLESSADLDDDLDDSPTIVLPMRLMAIEDAGLTDVGQQRKHNEDTYSIALDVHKTETPIGRTLHAKGLYILCDGMGGHAGGEVASALAVDVLREYFDQHWHEQLPTEAVIREGIVLANKAIFDVNQQNARFGSGRMGTTLVMLLIQDTYAIVAHVGDSRAYRYSRRLGLEQVTTDHEVGQREMQRGVDEDIAYARPDAYQLTQALGPRDEQFIDPSFEYLDLSEDTLLLLCSDGLSDNTLLETYSTSHLEPLLSSSVNLERGVVELINLANQHNGHDNITAIAVRVKVRPKINHL